MCGGSSCGNCCGRGNGERNQSSGCYGSRNCHTEEECCYERRDCNRRRGERNCPTRERWQCEESREMSGEESQRIIDRLLSKYTKIECGPVCHEERREGCDCCGRRLGGCEGGTCRSCLCVTRVSLLNFLVQDPVQ